MIFMGTFSGIVLPGIRAELVEMETPVTSVGDILSVASILFLFQFKKSDVDFVSGWQLVLVSLV